MTNVMIIGGGSGMGLALARGALTEGMDVTIVGRSATRLAASRTELEAGGHGTVAAVPADIRRDDEVSELFTQVERVDHVVVTAADATGVYGRTVDVETATARSIVDSKLLGAWLVGKYAAGRVTGSITFTRRASTPIGPTDRTRSWPRPTARSHPSPTDLPSSWRPSE